MTEYPLTTKNISPYVASQGRLAYVLRDKKLGQPVNQLWVYDISNPSGPRRVAVFDKLVFPEGFTVKGNRIYVFEKDIGIRILEFSYDSAKKNNNQNNIIKKVKASKSVTYDRKIVKTVNGAFSVDMIAANLSDPKLRILTDVAEQPYGCHASHCKVKTLGQFVLENNALAGINGTLFCPKDRAKPCGGTDGWFDWSVYNRRTNAVINSIGRGSMIIFTEKNKYFYYKDSLDFPGMYEFEYRFKEKISALISDEPLLVYKSNIVSTKAPNALMGRSTRSILGVRGSMLYLMTVRNATIDDLKAISKSLNMEYALALDGGGSSAMYYNGQYKLGPGRNIPNAIVVAER